MRLPFAVTVIVLLFVDMVSGADTVRRRSPYEEFLPGGLGPLGQRGGRNGGTGANKLLTNLLVNGVASGVASGSAAVLSSLLTGGRGCPKDDESTVLRVPLSLFANGLNMARERSAQPPIDVGELDRRVIELPVGQFVRVLNGLFRADPMIRDLGADIGVGFAGLASGPSSGSDLQALIEGLSPGLGSEINLESLVNGLGTELAGGLGPKSSQGSNIQALWSGLNKPSADLTVGPIVGNTQPPTVEPNAPLPSTVLTQLIENK